MLRRQLTDTYSGFYSFRTASSNYSGFTAPVVDILGGDAADQGVTRVAVRQQRADGEQHLRDGEGGAPLVLQDVQADHALVADM